MPISGLVITVRETSGATGDVMRRLASEPRLACGEPQGNRLPAVLETAQAGESRAVHEWLLLVPGVVNVDVVFVGFEEERSARD
jgi:hypothetical protein